MNEPEALTNKLNIRPLGRSLWVLFWADGGKLVDPAMMSKPPTYLVDLAQKRLAFNRGTPLSSSLSLSLSLSLSIYIDIYVIYNIYLVQDRSSSV